MKTSYFFAFFVCLGICVGCSSDTKITDTDSAQHENATGQNATKIKDHLVEASCGQCQFEMEGDGCDLAVRIDGKPYYVDGSSIDDHGDAHADDGLCNCIRKARVTGEIKNERFVASSFDVMPDDSEHLTPASTDMNGQEQNQNAGKDSGRGG